MNIQGVLDLESFQFTFVEGEKINAHTMQQMLEKLEAKNPDRRVIHVFLDNARYHHAKILQLSKPPKTVPIFDCHRRKKGWPGNVFRLRMR